MEPESVWGGATRAPGRATCKSAHPNGRTAQTAGSISGAKKKRQFPMGKVGMTKRASSESSGFWLSVTRAEKK